MSRSLLTIVHLRSLLAIAGFALTIATLSLPVSAQTGSSAKAKDAYDIALATSPDPPKMGENTLTVTVKGPDGKAVTDAEVTAMFYMAAMPAMKMPEMKNSIALKHEAAGKYVGKGQVMMAGNWDVTVSVKRGGKEIASKKVKVHAK